MHFSFSDVNKTQNGVTISMIIKNCIKLERHVFPVLHVMVGLATRLLKDVIDCSNLVTEDAPEALKDARHKQMEAEHTHDTIKKETTHWGT
jgi:hypothetical protein